MKLLEMLAVCLLTFLGACHFVKGQAPRQCSFDNGTCGFVDDQSGKDDFDWSKLNGPAESVTRYRVTRTIRHFWSWRPHYITRRVSYKTYPRGPRGDHTTGSGSYMYAKPRQAGARTGNLARLVSPVYTNVSCVKFYYFMYGNDIGGLEVLVKTGNNTPAKMWSLSGNQANAWKHATIPVNADVDETVKLYFQGVVGNPGKASVAIDDVEISSNQCSINPTLAEPKEVVNDGLGSCTFERSSCGYQNVKDDDFDWIKVGIESFVSTLGPRRDHTSGLGRYMHAEGSTRGSKARLVSPLLYNISCVSFYYYMFGSQIGTLNVYAKVQGNYTRLQEITGNQGSQWYKIQLVLGQDAVNKTFNIVFEAVNGGGYSGGVAIDDISISFNSCLASTPTSGPSVSPTSVIPDGSVRLVSGPTNYEGRVEVFHNGVWGTVCDDLWDLPDANVVCKMLGFPGAVRTTKSQVYGRGVGSIWLDDLNCKGSETSIGQCSHGGWGNNNCDHYEDAGVVCRLLDSNTTSPGDCTFEYDMCGYQNGDRMTSEFDWTRKRGPTPSSGTGPHNDQSGKGYYMYTEVSTGDTGARAKLISPMLPSNTKCISFYYHMRGSGIGLLNVYSKRETYQSIVKLWTLSGEQGNSWIQGQVPINVTGDARLRVIFEGIRGNSEKGDIAIDTIIVSNKSCNMTPSTATPPTINALEGDVRLLGDPNPLQGRVEVFHNGQWGTICNNMWSDEDATVVCRMLGYPGLGRALSSINKPRGVGLIWLDNVQCNGGERNLLQCRKNVWGRHSCDHTKDSWIACANGTVDDECTRYRILNSGDRSKAFAGQVNQCDRKSGIIPGQWHRFMGPAGDEMASSCVPENRCGTRASGWMNGGHPTVIEGMVTRKVCFSYFGFCCRWSTSIRVKNCSSFYVYELQKPPSCNLRYCGKGVFTPTIIPTTFTPASTPKPGQIRLAGGGNDYSGRVEVYHNGVWGTVCDDYWDMRDATVACRMLGFEGALKALSSAAFGRGHGRIWLDNVQCTGVEKSLGSCMHNGWGINNCGHYEDAGVKCSGEKMYQCDFEKNLCSYTTSNANNGLTWVRRQATGLASNHQPAFDYTLGAPTCLDGWSHLYKGHCYSLHNQETNITWLEAQKKCQQKNSLLADIRDKNEWIFIRNQVLSNVSLQYYIGIRDANGTGIWKYGDGTVLNLTNVWMKGKPSNAGKDKCGAIVSGSSSDVGRFIDVSCNQTYGQVSYMCKTNRYRSNLGYYLQMQSGAGSRSRSQLATLVSSELLFQFTCLTFYYQMIGRDVDSLRVVFRSPKKDVLVWQLEGNYSNDGGNYSNGWNKAQIPLNFTASDNIRIVIQAARFSMTGNIDIDDVNVTSAIPSHLCNVYPPKARPRKWDDGMFGSCNFENGTCGYTNDNPSLEYTKWIKRDLAKLSGTNLPYDHSTYSVNKGSYMFMERSLSQSTGQSARLISPTLSPDQARCMSFYFYLYRKSNPLVSDVELTVYVRPSSQTSIGNEIAIWKMTGTQITGSDAWTKAVIPLNQKTNFQLIFESVLIGSVRIALDDIWISASSDCIMLPINASPPPLEKPKNSIRLTSSAANGVGRVEVYHHGRWGSVCGNKWTLDNAHVVCRQLGYEGASTFLTDGRVFGPGSGRIWLSDVDCSGREPSITRCNHRGWGNNNCLHKQDTVVVCNTGESSDKEIQLQLNGTSNNYQGRVNVNYVGIWGTLKGGNGWNIFAATVACRQLGFAGAISAVTGSAFGKVQTQLWNFKFHCHGNETRLSQCTDYASISYLPASSKTTDAGVECFGARLVGGKKPNEGRVQIQYRGKWGSICGKEWNMNAAHVICRNLGYQRAKFTSLVPKGSDTVLLDEVKCQGDEASILLCLHLGINVHSCDNFGKVVNVQCSNDNTTQVNPCDTNACRNGGKCSKVGSDFVCECSSTFIGKTCKTFIGYAVVDIVLRNGSIKWNPLQFKESLAKTLNRYCNECKEQLSQETQDGKKPEHWIFTPNDIIIIHDPIKQPSRKVIIVEYAVVKTVNENMHIIDAKKVREAVTKGVKDGIAGYEVMLVKEDKGRHFNNASILDPQTKTRIVTESSDGFKIGFAVVLVLLITIVVAAAVIHMIRRYKKHPMTIAYQLKTFYKKPHKDKEQLVDADYTSFNY